MNLPQNLRLYQIAIIDRLLARIDAMLKRMEERR